jgi:hypothetical protein
VENMSKKIKRDYSRIVDEICLIDERLFNAIISNTFYPEEIKQIKLPYNLEPSSLMFTSIIVDKCKEENYIELLNQTIMKNRKNINHILNTSMNFEEITNTIESQKDVLEIKRGVYYFLILLEFYSKNLFKGVTVYALRDKCKEVFEYTVKRQEESGKKKKETIELCEELKGSQTENTFNAFFYEYDIFDEAIARFDPKEIAKKYECSYEKNNKTYNNVRRGILYFIDEEMYRVKKIHLKVYKLMNDISQMKNEVIDEKIELQKIRENYFKGTEKTNRFKKTIKNLKKENKRLNTQVLKRIDKSNNIELENRVHNLEKDKYYLQSRIEKMEEQIAVFEEEKKLNKELQDNIEIQDEIKKDKLAFSETEPPIIAQVPEYQNIVIMGGRWTSNHRKEVTEYLANNEVEFIEADKTLRHWDRIKNADIIFYDTSYNAHSYYYKAKKLGSVFYHVNTSSLIDIKKIYEQKDNL